MRKRRQDLGGPDTFTIKAKGALDIEVKYHAPQLALTQAQMAAVRAEKPVSLEVVRTPLLGGQAHVVYRVVRDEDGAVLTYTIAED